MWIEEITSFNDAYEAYSLSSTSPEKDALRRFDSVGGSMKGSTDADGNSKAEVEGHLKHKGDDGSTTTAEVSISGERSADGKISGEVKAEVKYEKEFNLLKV